MIESYYWRQELREDIRWLREHQSYRRWTEKQAALFERRLILAAFQIRTLIEQKRVRSSVSLRKVDCFRYPKVGEGPVTRINSHRIEQHFALDEPVFVALDAWAVANQLIHHYEMMLATEPKLFTAVLVFSDRARNTALYMIPLSELLDLFGLFGSDESSVVQMRSVWNPKKEDYDVFL